MVGLRKQWHKFLNWLIPGRRERLLSKIMELDQDLGLYECCGNWDEFGECSCKNTKDEIR